MREKNEDDHIPYRRSTGVGHHGLERTVLMRLPTARTGTETIRMHRRRSSARSTLEKRKGKEREREREEGFDENL